MAFLVCPQQMRSNALQHFPFSTRTRDFGLGTQVRRQEKPNCCVTSCKQFPYNRNLQLPQILYFFPILSILRHVNVTKYFFIYLLIQLLTSVRTHLITVFKETQYLTKAKEAQFMLLQVQYSHSTIKFLIRKKNPRTSVTSIRFVSNLDIFHFMGMAKKNHQLKCNSGKSVTELKIN